MMIIKSFVLTTITTGIALSFSQEAKAGDISNYEDYRLYCSPIAVKYRVQSSDCHLDQDIYENRLQQEVKKQPIRGRSTGKKVKTSHPANQKNFYFGVSLGAVFPTEDVEFISDLLVFDLETGLAGSLFFGKKFNRNFGLDLEVARFGGNADLGEFESPGFDLSYSQNALFLNPRFELPLSKSKNSVAVFFSPGIGIAQGRITQETDDRKVSEEDDIRFAWQAKAGLHFPFSKKYSGFTQVRYLNATGDIALFPVPVEIGINLFTVELGAIIKF